MHRASTLSSNSVEQAAEEKKIMEALGDNGYPLGFIRRHSDNRTSRRTEDDQRLPKTSLTLPYIGGLSEAVRTLLRPLDIKVALRPLRTLCHQLAHPKDHVPRNQQAGVVYQIPCSDCIKAYNGQEDPETRFVWTPTGTRTWLHLHPPVTSFTVTITPFKCMSAFCHHSLMKVAACYWNVGRTIVNFWLAQAKVLSYQRMP